MFNVCLWFFCKDVRESAQKFTNNRTFMITNSLNIDRMESFMIDKVIFVAVWSKDPNMRPVNTSNHAGKLSTSEETVFVVINFCNISRPLNKLRLLCCQEPGDIVHYS